MRHPTWPDEKSAKAFALRLDGYSFAEIARELQTTRSAVSSFLCRHGVSAVDDDSPSPSVKNFPRPERDRVRAGGYAGSHPFEIPTPRVNDCKLHLTLMLAAMRQARAA